ncbi:hypothetical protein ACOME3_009028 [Neoechinorhynchus agilis]
MKKFEVRAWNYNNNEWQDKRIIFTQRGCKTKEEAYLKYGAQLRSKLHTFKKWAHSTINLSPTAVTIRNHLVPALATDKTRGVYAYPYDIWHIETILYYDLIQQYKKKFKLPKGDCFYGIDIPPPAGGLNQLLDSLKNFHFDKRWMCDFSEFDKSLANFWIDAAFRIINSNIDPSHYLTYGTPNVQSIMRMMRLVKDYFINTPLVLSNGRIYHKANGVPSGSLLTNLVDTIANALIINYVIAKNFPEYEAPLYGQSFMGDDSVVSFYHADPVTNRRVTVEELADMFWECGLILNVSKFVISDVEIEYLGYKLKAQGTLPTRDMAKVIASCLAHITMQL